MKDLILEIYDDAGNTIWRQTLFQISDEEIDAHASKLQLFFKGWSYSTFDYGVEV